MGLPLSGNFGRIDQVGTVLSTDAFLLNTRRGSSVVNDRLGKATAAQIVAAGGGGDMFIATYDPAGVSEQLTGITATQTLTNKTVTNLILNGTATGTAVLDEDDMISDSDTQIATQQSIKAYVDNTIGGDMNTATYDPAAIAEQLVGITATQTISNKTIQDSALILRTNNITVTGSVTNADDVHFVDATSGDITITLFTASGNTGRLVNFIRTDSSNNSVTVDANGAETINGELTATLLSGDSLVIISNGTNWFVR